MVQKRLIRPRQPLSIACCARSRRSAKSPPTRRSSYQAFEVVTEVGKYESTVLKKTVRPSSHAIITMDYPANASAACAAFMTRTRTTNALMLAADMSFFCAFNRHLLLGPLKKTTCGPIRLLALICQASSNPIGRYLHKPQLDGQPSYSWQLTRPIAPEIARVSKGYRSYSRLPELHQLLRWAVISVQRGSRQESP